jgi:hypothetical protein
MSVASSVRPREADMKRKASDHSEDGDDEGSIRALKLAAAAANSLVDEKDMWRVASASERADLATALQKRTEAFKLESLSLQAAKDSQRNREIVAEAHRLGSDVFVTKLKGWSAKIEAASAQMQDFKVQSIEERKTSVRELFTASVNELKTAKCGGCQKLIAVVGLTGALFLTGTTRFPEVKWVRNVPSVVSCSLWWTPILLEPSICCECLPVLLAHTYQLLKSRPISCQLLYRNIAESYTEDGVTVEDIVTHEIVEDTQKLLFPDAVVKTKPEDETETDTEPDDDRPRPESRNIDDFL